MIPRPTFNINIKHNTPLLVKQNSACTQL